MSNGIDSTSTIVQSAIASGTAVTLTQPDHTTQIISVIVQIVALVGWWLRSRKTKNSEQ